MLSLSIALSLFDEITFLFQVVGFTIWQNVTFDMIVNANAKTSYKVCIRLITRVLLYPYGKLCSTGTHNERGK